ncbi:MAG TPA: LysR family transcriptional regulator [Gemmatimonadaceae bacterium]
MILRHLRYFATAADEGGVTRAAARLRMAQPALSRSIHDLEEAVGATLLERDNRGVRLTPAGVVLRDGIDLIHAHLIEALRLVALAHEGRVATLRIGMSREALHSQTLGRVIAAYRKKYPDVELVVSELPMSSQPAALRSAEVDGAISAGAEDDSAIQCETLFQDRINSAMLAVSHPLAGASALTPEELRSVPLRLDASSVARLPALRTALDQLGFAWEEVDGVDTALSYVAAGNGWLPALRSLQSTSPAGLVVKPVIGLDVPVPMVLRWNSAQPGAALHNLLAIASRVVAEEEDGEPSRRRRSSSPRLQLLPDASGGGIELRQLRALVTSIEEGSLSAAATRLSVTQSAISRQVRSLEDAVGVQLLNRGGRRLVATAAGEALRGAATVILGILDETLQRARATSRGITARCTIGSVPRELTNGVLVSALQQLTQLHPELSVSVVENPAPDSLFTREVDLTVTSMFPGAVDNPMISTVLLRDDPLDCALLAESHPLAKREWIQPAELMGHPFLFISRSYAPSAYDHIIGALQKFGIAPTIGGEFNGARVLWSLVAGGDGWALGTRSLRTNPPAGIVARPIEGLHIPWAVGLMWRKNESDPVIKQVIEVFRNPQRLQV